MKKENKMEKNSLNRGISDNLVNSMERAKMLMDATTTPEFERYASRLSKMGYVDYDDADIEGVVPYNESVHPQTTRMPSYNPNADMEMMRNVGNMPIRNNRLPKGIIDSFTENPCTGLSSDPIMEAFTSTLNESSGKSKPRFSDMSRKTSNITETEKRGNTEGGGGIDYEMLKMIIEGVVKKYMDELKTSMLNESVQKNPSNNIQAVTLGNNFRFVDKSGNIYVANLTYKGNINDMKTKK